MIECKVESDVNQQGVSMWLVTRGDENCFSDHVVNE
jgi:hypothetical protein